MSYGRDIRTENGTGNRPFQITVIKYFANLSVANSTCPSGKLCNNQSGRRVLPIMYYLTIILRDRAEYRLMLNRRGRRPSRLKSRDIAQD